MFKDVPVHAIRIVRKLSGTISAARASNRWRHSQCEPKCKKNRFVASSLFEAWKDSLIKLRLMVILESYSFEFFPLGYPVNCYYCLGFNSLQLVHHLRKEFGSNKSKDDGLPLQRSNFIFLRMIHLKRVYALCKFRDFIPAYQ